LCWTIEKNLLIHLRPVPSQQLGASP
jgi:hypothetical protein